MANKISIPKKLFDEIFRDGGQKAVFKQLTGDFELGVNRDQSNAEVEDGEFIQDQQGVKEVIGKRHEEGGVPVQLDNGDKILSNHLQIGAPLAKKLKESFEIPVKATDTYAKVLAKYNKKLGLDEITEELEEYMELMKKQKTKVKDKNTSNINIDFLSKEIQEYVQKKEPLEEKKQMVFDLLFQEQEASKGGPTSKNTMMEDGGMWLEQIAQQYGITPQRAQQLLSQDKFVEGGEKLNPIEGEFNAGLGSNVLYKAEVGKQKANASTFGSEKDLNTIVQEWYKNFPSLVLSDKTFGKYVSVGPKGKVTWKGGLDLNKKQEVVGNFQKLVDDNQKNSANHVINNPTVYGEEAVKMAKDYLANQTFVKGEGVRGIDSKLGDFTAGVRGLSLGLATEQDKNLLNENGIYTLSQVDENSEIFKKLTPEAQNSIKQTKSRIGKTNADYIISAYKTKPVTDTQAAAEQPAGIGTFGQAPQTNKTVQGGLLSTPTRAYNMPTWMPSLKTTTRLPRIEGIQVSPEQALSEIDRSVLAAKQNLQGLPPAQQAAAMASITANQIAASSKATQEAAKQNAQLMQSVNAYNAQLGTQEAQAENQNALSYEARTFTGLGNYENDLNNLMNQQFADQQQKWKYTEMINRQNALNPDVQFTGEGFQVYSPQLSDLQKEKVANEWLASQAPTQKEKPKTTTAKTKGKFGGRFSTKKKK